MKLNKMANQSLFGNSSLVLREVNEKENGDILVIDLETQKEFTEVGSRSAHHLLRVSVLGMYSYKQDKYFCFEERQLPQAAAMLQAAQKVVGFNIKGFDLPVLAPYLQFDWYTLPIVDIFEEVYHRLGHRVSLDSIAQATLNTSKSSHGLEAIKMFKEGRLEELKNYCLDDVRITKKIYDFGRKNGFLLYKSLDGAQDLKVEVSLA